MDLRLSSAVEEVTILYRDDKDRRSSRTVYKRGGKRSRKGTGPFDTIGRLVRKCVESQESAAKTYLNRHKDSNREKTDGWARDIGYNVYRATRRGLRKARGAAGLPSIDLDD